MMTSLAAVAMTFVLGFLSTAAAFFIVGGQLALQGTYVLVREWPWIYSLVVVLAAAIGFVVGWLRASWPRRRLAIVIVGGWLGEYLVLVVLGAVTYSEINPVAAVVIWVVATAGPAQPVAAWLGAIVGQQRRRRRSLALFGESSGIRGGVGDPSAAQSIGEAAE
jgi:hypothetical protein